MAQTQYTYSISTNTLNGIVQSIRLSDEISTSAIVIALDFINTNGDSLEVYMKDSLSAGDKTILDGLVAAHTGDPLPDEATTVKVTEEPPFTAKTINGLKLYTRVHGVQQAVIIGENTIDFLVPYNQVKFNGLELIGGSLGDKVDLEILDTPTGTISTVPYYKLNQFGYGVNVGAGYFKRESQYDADLIKDMTIRAKYTSTVAGFIYINYLIHELKA